MALSGPGDLVSIALCTYNGAEHLAAQLDSLLAQDHPRLELVACDDASTDASFELLQAHAPRFTSARLMRNPRNLGLQANFEQVFRACRGDWIAPCDQDDRWRPDKLSRLLRHADEKTTLVYADSALIDAAGLPWNGGERVSDRYRMVSGSDPRMFALANCISGHSSLFRRGVLARALPLPEGVLHDAWIAFVAANVGTIRYVDAALVEFRQHHRNASGFAGQLKQGRRRSAAERFDVELHDLEAKASFDGPQQAFFAELLRLWKERPGRWATPALARFLHAHREQVFAMKPSAPGAKGRHAMKYLRGLRGRLD
ncbi:MAG TPA: glycosyltransferase [Albitalea sp.]|jgi:glycosyltransferase involved in cell wall biosynthesis|nr:glycosyltransferase [Albitalea sp.]